MIDDEKIIDLFFERSEQGIRELDNKYGAVCHNLSYNIVNNRQDAEECVNDAYLRSAAPRGLPAHADASAKSIRSEHDDEMSKAAYNLSRHFRAA